MIRAAIAHVKENGGRVVEAYPTVVKKGQRAPVSSFMGFPESFEREGFVECARPSERKAVMRYVIENS